VLYDDREEDEHSLLVGLDKWTSNRLVIKHFWEAMILNHIFVHKDTCLIDVYAENR